MALVVAWMLHLVVDQMWLHEAVLFWPFFGWDIVIPATGGFWAAAWQRALSDPWRWVLELVCSAIWPGCSASGLRQEGAERPSPPDASAECWLPGRVWAKRMRSSPSLRW